MPYFGLMSLYIASLNSGSNGNCYYIGNGSEGIFIDAGISCRETERRMKRLGLPITGIKAIFITHEHADHILGAEALSKKYRLPVFITNATLRFSGLSLPTELISFFTAEDAISIGSFCVVPFSKQHDATDPHSFVVVSEGICIGVFTDIGAVCSNVTTYFSQCHAAFLEANYDAAMLSSGKYPYHLKQRISGVNGHLSNDAALRLFNEHRPNYMTHLVLSHLSENNNNPALVEQLFMPHAGPTQIIVASRRNESGLLRIDVPQHKLNGALNRPLKQKKAYQLSIF